MTKSILKKLKRYREMVEAREHSVGFHVNPNGHPLPTIPELDVLADWYLAQLVSRIGDYELKKREELLMYYEKHRSGKNSKEA